MKYLIRLFSDALRLSRINNLIIVALTQYFAAIFLISDYTTVEILSDIRFFGVVLSTVILSASGYFINDYYDIKIDLVNKPKKVIVGKNIKRRYVMVAHLIFNGIGVLLSTWISLWIGLVSIVSAFLLWLYSNRLKRLPLVGNLVVAALTGATLLLLNLYFDQHNILVYTYAFLAFGINLIREIVKDCEDLKGDASFGARSLVVVLGIRRTKWVLYFVVGLYALALYFFILAIKDYLLTIYFCLMTIPFIYFCYLLYKADTTAHFGILSQFCKWLIIAGILSMITLRF